MNRGLAVAWWPALRGCGAPSGRGWRGDYSPLCVRSELSRPTERASGAPRAGIPAPHRVAGALQDAPRGRLKRGQPQVERLVGDSWWQLDCIEGHEGGIDILREGFQARRHPLKVKRGSRPVHDGRTEGGPWIWRPYLGFG